MLISMAEWAAWCKTRGGGSHSFTAIGCLGNGLDIRLPAEDRREGCEASTERGRRAVAEGWRPLPSHVVAATSRRGSLARLELSSASEEESHLDVRVPETRGVQSGTQ